MLTSTERKFLIRALNRALTVKISAIRDVREILDDKNLTFDDLIIGKQETKTETETETETETNIETALAGLKFPASLTPGEETDKEKTHIKPIPTNATINNLEYANLHISLLTPRQQEFIMEKFTSRDNNWIANGKNFTQKQNEYLDVIVTRIASKIR